MPIKSKAKKPPGAATNEPPPVVVVDRSDVDSPAAGIPSISTRDLSYFFNTAAALYQESSASKPVDPNAPPPTYENSNSSSNNSNDVPDWFSQIDQSAVLVLRLFRQTLTHIRPVAERFHLGPADRQPLYALTAQPSPRSAAEFNELCIKRREPTTGVWHGVCTSDIEPNLDMTSPGHYKVASLTMDAVPVWKRVVAGQVRFENAEHGRGNKLRLWWGDRKTLGSIGEAYSLWWESGAGAGGIEAFYVVQWRGFESDGPGIVMVKPAVKDENGQYIDPRTIQQSLAVLYIHGDAQKTMQFVCQDVSTQIRLDFVMSGLMTVLTLETRKADPSGNLGRLMAHELGLRHAR